MTLHRSLNYIKIYWPIVLAGASLIVTWTQLSDAVADHEGRIFGLEQVKGQERLVRIETKLDFIMDHMGWKYRGR